MRQKRNTLGLSDGTKLGVFGADGRGFEYLGSLVYVRDGSNLTLESAAFGGGRIVKSETSAGDIYTANYFITDHLGSVRVAVDGSGGLVQTNDYYPFGMKHQNSNYPASTNRYRFHGKEEQRTGNLGFSDHGARMYSFMVGRFNTQDQLNEEFKSISSYVFCANNPLRFIDPTGMFYTDYRNERGELLFKTNDNLSDIIIIPEREIEEFKARLTDLNEKEKIDDPKSNKEELHSLGRGIERLKDLILTGDSSLDVGINRGYNEAYNDKKVGIFTKIGRFMAGVDDENAKINTGHIRGEDWGKTDREAGRINKINPYSSLKNNKPLINLKNKK